MDIMSLENGYKYKLTDGFIMTCYDDALNYFVDNHFGGEFTYDDLNEILRVLNQEPYEKWFGTIDEICLFQHFMREQNINKITVVERGVKLF
jgi:hypothetical protein